MVRTVLLIVTLGLGLVHCCDESKMVECSTRFIAAIGGSDALVVKTEEQIDQACSKAFPTFKTCMKGASSGCSQVPFQGMIDSFDYVCGAGREDHIEFAPCLGKSGVRKEVAECQKTFSPDPGQPLDVMCGRINDNLDCQYNAAEKECGDDAAEHQLTLSRLSMGQITGAMECDIGAASRTVMGWTVACVVILQSLVVYMSF